MVNGEYRWLHNASCSCASNFGAGNLCLPNMMLGNTEASCHFLVVSVISTHVGAMHCRANGFIRSGRLWSIHPDQALIVHFWNRDLSQRRGNELF